MRLLTTPVVSTTYGRSTRRLFAYFQQFTVLQAICYQQHKFARSASQERITFGITRTGVGCPPGVPRRRLRHPTNQYLRECPINDDLPVGGTIPHLSGDRAAWGSGAQRIRGFKGFSEAHRLHPIEAPPIDRLQPVREKLYWYTVGSQKDGTSNPRV